LQTEEEEGDIRSNFEIFQYNYSNRKETAYKKRNNNSITALKSENILSTVIAGEKEDGAFVLSLTKQREANLNSRRKLLLTVRDAIEPDFLTSLSPESQRNQANIEVNQRMESLELPIEDENDVPDFVSTTISSLRDLEENRTERIIKYSLNKRTSSGFFKILCVKFYAVVILTLLSQLLLKRISDSTMDDLLIKNDLLNYAQTRAYYACKMPFAIETSYLLSIGIDVYSYYDAGVALPPKTLIKVLLGYYLELATANNNIIKLLGSLDDGMPKSLFTKDVRIFGSIHDVEDEEFSMFTNFQAVEKLGVSVRYLTSLPDAIAPNTTAAYKFIRRNTLGDFLVKNKEVTEIFQESVNDEKSSLNNFVLLCLILNPIALVIVASILSLILWGQYSNEKALMEAFIRLDPNCIKLIAENIKDFKHALVDECRFEEKGLLESFWNQFILVENLKIKSHQSERNTKTIVLGKIQKKYFLFVVQMGIYTAVLIGVLLWNFISVRNSLDVIYTKQNQLQLSNYISETVNIDLMGMVEMFMSNNTFNVSGSSPLEHTIEAVQKIGSLRSQILTDFEEFDGTYKPILKTIVFDGEECSVYPGFNENYCLFLNNNGILTNLVSLLAFFESFMTSQLKLFENLSAPSEGDLIVGLYSRAGEMAPATSLLAFIALKINNIVSREMTEYIADTGQKQASIVKVFLVTLIIMSLLIWIKILSKIKEANNDFKKVLQIFPPKLILSSFLLKKFLDKYSKNHFEL